MMMMMMMMMTMTTTYFEDLGVRCRRNCRSSLAEACSMDCWCDGSAEMAKRFVRLAAKKNEPFDPGNILRHVDGDDDDAMAAPADSEPAKAAAPAAAPADCRLVDCKVVISCCCIMGLRT